MCGPMAVVKLPEGVVPPSANLSPPYSDPAAHAVMNILHFQYKIEVRWRDYELLSQFTCLYKQPN